MKILFLSSHINAEHQLAQSLEARGVALLFAQDALDGVQILRLHGNSIDLVIAHRENGTQGSAGFPGLEFIEQVRAIPIYADLPIILTTEVWSDEECLKHQESSLGVNAYLHTPIEEVHLVAMIEAVLGKNIGGSSLIPTPPPGVDASALLARPSFVAEPGEMTVLRDTREIFTPAQKEGTISQFHFEAPESVDEAEDLGPISMASEPSIMIPGPVVTNVSEGAPIRPPVSQESVSIHLTGLELRPNLSAAAAEKEQGSTVKSAPNVDADGEPLDSEAAQSMGYLFRKKRGESFNFNTNFLQEEPVGDAVIPGGAAQSPDLETFKRYLLLREQDVAVLSNQLKSAKDQITNIEQSLKEERAKNSELMHIVNEQKQKIENFDKDKMRIETKFEAEIRELNSQLRAKADKAILFESKIQESDQEMDHLKDRIRIDIRKIRVREKELENRLEIAKRDSEALLGAREARIIELKRKLDLLEFNIDLLQDRYNREKDRSRALTDRLDKAGQIMKVAGGLLEPPAITKVIEKPKNENSEVSPQSALPSRRVS